MLFLATYRNQSFCIMSVTVDLLTQRPYSYRCDQKRDVAERDACDLCCKLVDFVPNCSQTNVKCKLVKDLTAMKCEKTLALEFVVCLVQMQSHCYQRCFLLTVGHQCTVCVYNSADSNADCVV